MNTMFAINATDVRKDWSTVIDSVIRVKPAFIKRTRDYMILSDIGLIEILLEPYEFHAILFVEEDGSITVSLDEIDLVETGIDEQDAIIKMASGILEYAEDYYNDYKYWARGNRKAHLPYVLKVLILNDVTKIGELIKCRHGDT